MKVKTYSYNEFCNMVNNTDFIFVGYVANNLNYVGVNAFVHRLHDVEGIDHIKGVIVNLRNDPNYGHSFAEDSYRFPSYCDIEIVHIADENVVNNEKAYVKLWRFLKNRLSLFKAPRLYIISDRPSIISHVSMVYVTGRNVEHILINQGSCCANIEKWIVNFLKEASLVILERLLAGAVVSFRAFSVAPGMKRFKGVERFYRKATEDERLVLSEIDYNRKYIVFISQSHVYKEFNSIVESILDDESAMGYDIYIKPHSHERIPCFPQKANYHVLPKSYAIESIVGSAPRKPDKIIGVASTTLFTCSAWFGIPCYTILDMIPYGSLHKEKKQFVKLVEGSEYPNLLFYGKTKEEVS